MYGVLGRSLIQSRSPVPHQLRDIVSGGASLKCRQRTGGLPGFLRSFRLYVLIVVVNRQRVGYLAWTSLAGPTNGGSSSFSLKLDGVVCAWLPWLGVRKNILKLPAVVLKPIRAFR